MLETSTQRSQAAVRDPVCGMAIEPAQAFATRTLGEETFYFCSERCVQQFDREHMSSATTGVSDTGKLRRIEISVADFEGRHSAKRLEEQLKRLAGVQQATAIPQTKLIRIAYAPLASLPRGSTRPWQWLCRRSSHHRRWLRSSMM